MKQTTRLVVGLAAFTLAACDYTEAHDMLIRDSSEQSGRPVALFFAGESPRRPFREIAMLEVIGHGADADTAQVEYGLRQRAEEFGCDAVVRVHINQSFAMARGAGVCARYSSAESVACAPVPPLPGTGTCEAAPAYVQPLPPCRQ